MKIPENTGLLIRAPQPTDWIAGGETGIALTERNAKANWKDYIPGPERQKGRTIETMACVTYSALNLVETQIRWMIAAGMISNALVEKMQKLGYFDANCNLNFSDRFTAKMSGTGKTGNYLTAVWDSIRNHGLVPEKDWPSDVDKFTWDEYYKEIPQAIKDKAQKFREIFEVKYEFVFNGSGNSTDEIREHITQAPLQLAAPVCKPWAGGVIKSCGSDIPQHATQIFGFNLGVEIDIFDTYDPFTKKLAWDYPMPYVLKGLVDLKVTQEPLFPTWTHNFTKDLEYGQRNSDVAALQHALKADGVFPANVLETGYYGLTTSKAVTEYQRKYKIAPETAILSLMGKSSRVGPMTRVVLNKQFNK
jgi:hypothetical protein